MNHYKAWNGAFLSVEVPQENALYYQNGLPNYMTLVAEYDLSTAKSKEAQGPATSHGQVNPDATTYHVQDPMEVISFTSK